MRSAYTGWQGEAVAFGLWDTMSVPLTPWEWQSGSGRLGSTPTRFDLIGALTHERPYKPHLTGLEPIDQFIRGKLVGPERRSN